jgi:hypothetical protein
VRIEPTREMTSRVNVTKIGSGLAAVFAACLLVPTAATATDCGLPGSPGAEMSPVLDVQGDIAASRTGGYLQIPFTIDPGTTGIQVRYSYDQADGGCGGPNTLDMGVYQPKANPASTIFEQSDRRGWSGSAVKNLAIAENGFTDESTYNADRKAFVDGHTTRAYKPGAIPAGTWAVELGIAYVDPADSDGIHYHVQVLVSSDSIWSDDPYQPSGPPDDTINSTPGWYTGDLHVHGEQEPGNATMTDTFAAAFGPGGAGLDFITLVDHNNNIAHDDMQAQADVYPDNLVIPGVEVTTYHGHWNDQAFGSGGFAGFRTGPIYGDAAGATPPYDDSDLVEERGPKPPKGGFAKALGAGAWTQINHPAYFRDDPAACRGCAWTYSDADTDFSKVDAIEIANSIGALQASLPFTTDAIAYYEHALDSGAHIAVVGSSDAHKADADPISPVGQGATVVHADGLSRKAIVEGVKADHTYVKPFGTSGPDITLKVKTDGGAKGIIGDTVAGRSAKLSASVSGAAATGRAGDWSLLILEDGVAIDTVPFTGDGTSADMKVSDAGRYSVEVVRSSGGTDLIEDYSSPIWLTKIKVGKPKPKKRKGTATVDVKTSGAGAFVLSGPSLRTVDARAHKATTKTLKIRPDRKLKKKLKRRGHAKAKAVVTFTPAGGKPATEKLTVRLVRRR